EEYPGRFEQNLESGKGDDVCAIVYTSGTTGTPKGAVHTHQTMRAGADNHLRLDRWYENDNVVPYLPPAWMNEQWFGIGCHLLSGCTLNFAEAPETQQRDTRETGPSIVSYGARIWESQAAALQAQILGADVIQRFAFRLLMPIGYKVADRRLRKKRLGPFLRGLDSLADLILFRPIRKSLGLSHARICYTTGAVLSSESFRFYHALNLPLKSLYGTTEGGALTGARDEDIRLNTVGPVHEGAEVRITDRGELFYRQAGVFVGYYKDPEKTAGVLKDGWFCSGDRCFVDENGHMVFVDRVGDVIDLACGDQLAPQSIESRLRFSPYIRDAWVFCGPKKEYASVVIIIDYVNVGRWAGQRKVAYNTFTELSQKPEVDKLVAQEIDRINSSLPPGSRVKKYVNLHKELDPDENELTRTRKLRRAFLEMRYRELIDAIYADQTEVPIEVQAKHPDGRTVSSRAMLRIKTIKGAVV
ncbi:MAG TPA: AMP-binding protein, partial [Desulfatiglandales bacterium]|nr:AMP-binding protein [Desulfatiglandales bacterium]